MDRRRHYVEVALSLFAEQGFHGVSVDEIVAAAGGSKATLYRYFPSKAAVFEAIIADLSAVNVDDPPVEALLELPLEQGLRAIGHGTARAAFSAEATVLFRLAVAEANQFPELAEIMFRQGPGRTYDRLRCYLRARAEIGETEIPDLQIAAEQFLGGIVGHQQLRIALGQPPPDATAVTARVEAAIGAFKAAYPPGRT